MAGPKKPPFEPGNTISKSGGRPIGYRQKLADQFTRALFNNFEQHGLATLELMRINDPSGYINIIAKLLPKQITGEDGGPVVVTHVSYTWAKDSDADAGS